ncbi:MAG: SPOR domain-containing protein [Candidatus Eisenbacteria bacterium]|nr:SPOR domain-containing protein [Candidatus Eisenbacteria bacterium]
MEHDRNSPASGADASDELVSPGLCVAVLAAELAWEDGGPVRVRAEADEQAPSWTTPLSEHLGAGPGAVVGVTAKEPMLAAAVAVKLAVGVADGGRRVVIADGSLHAPAIAKPLEGDGDEGLVDSVLFGVSTAVTARRTLAPGVSVMTSGSVPVLAEDVFRADAFETTVRGFAQDVTVFLALPAVFLAGAGRVLSHLVVAGTTADEMRSVAEQARSAGTEARRTVGVLVSRPRPLRPAGVAPQAELPRRETIATEPVSESAVEEQPAPTPQPPVPPADDAGAATPAAPVWQPRRSPMRTAAGPAAGAETRQRRRSSATVPATVAVLVLGAVAVAWWLGTSRSPQPPARTAGPTGAGERPAAEVPVEVAGGTGLDAEPAPVGGQGTEGQPPAPAPRETAAAVPAAPPTAAGPGGPYVIFVSSHRSQSAAEADAGALAARGIPSAVVRAEVGDRGAWYRVRVAGGYPTLAAARDGLESVRRLAYEGAWIERAPESD